MGYVLFSTLVEVVPEPGDSSEYGQNQSVVSGFVGGWNQSPDHLIVELCQLSQRSIPDEAGALRGALSCFLFTHLVIKTIKKIGQKR